MRLTPPDEYFNHQTSHPHMMVGSSDPNWRERYWVCVQDRERDDFVLTFGFGKYPNRDVMEAYAIVNLGDRQWNLRVSREIADTSHEIAAGPLSAEVIEPLDTLRFRLEPNASQIAFDLTWKAKMPAMLEGHHFEVNRSRVTHDLTRYVQLGRVEGWVQVGPSRLTLSFDNGWAERDHSWGIRPMASAPGEPPAAPPDWNFLAFCPIQMETFGIHIYLFERQHGDPTHLSACISFRDGSEEASIRGVDHDFDWDFDTPVRTLKSGSITLHFFGHRPSMTIAIKGRRPRVFLRGAGFGLDQGRWRGESSFDHEQWDLSDESRLKQANSSSSDHVIEAEWGDQKGLGIIEYIVRKGHKRYGRPR